jgi:hypothetical protein
MRALKIAVIVVLVYVGIVAVFESLLGYFQPASESTIVITTFDGDGNARDRVVSPVEDGGRLYVSANHWPRSWYDRALANPEVQVTAGGATTDYVAVPVTGAEDERLRRDHAHPVFFRILTGFPPRYFLRLDPRSP